MSSTRSFTVSLAAVLLITGCSGDLTVPDQTTSSSTPLLPESLSPNRNLEIILRPVAGGSGFGLVKFRQPKDDEAIVNLDTWVRDLLPNTSYQLQRATDVTIDDVCVGTNWLTLGPRSILTDDRGTGREALFRNLSAVPLGSVFDIHFRVIDQAGVVVLQSNCYQFVVAL